MSREGTTVEAATREWVNEFNVVPREVLVKLMELNPDEVHEITPPVRGDRVYVFSGEREDRHGSIVSYDEKADEYVIKLDSGEEVKVDESGFEVERDSYLPMWGSLWTFGDSADDYWLEELEGLRAMAECGLRIYEQDDYGYLFGVDGCGYSFLHEHFIPLYRARGLKWHDPETEKEEK